MSASSRPHVRPGSSRWISSSTEAERIEERRQALRNVANNNMAPELRVLDVFRGATDVRAVWESDKLDDDRRRIVISTLYEPIVIGRGNARRIDVDRVGLVDITAASSHTCDYTVVTHLHRAGNGRAVGMVSGGCALASIVPFDDHHTSSGYGHGSGCRHACKSEHNACTE